MFIIIFIFISIVSSLISHGEKITLFDSSKFQDDLNWIRFSFKENLTANNELNIITHSKNDIYGWKEGSFVSPKSDEVWRIYFACDLNVQNIHNWLFLPLIHKQEANRLTLNLTFTIRECEQFPLRQQFKLKTCREKFELYYEEVDDNFNENELTNDLVLNKIKQLKFRDTFVSDNARNYYQNQQRKDLTGFKTGDSISIETRDIILNTNKSFIRFAIRDTGACVSLLRVQVDYLKCPKVNLHGITFNETPIGKELTDLIEINGQCPLYSTYSQVPKAICTGKGEWLITDQLLNNRCLCLPGYEFIDSYCSPCQPGYYKSTTSNQDKCLVCPLNSISTRLGSDKCDCKDTTRYYRDDPFNSTLECKEFKQFTSSSLEVTYLNKQNEIDVGLLVDNKTTNKLKEDVNCFKCDFDDNCIYKCGNRLFLNPKRKIEKFKFESLRQNSSIQMIINQIQIENTQIKSLNCKLNDKNTCYLINIQLNLYQAREMANKIKVYESNKNSYNYTLIKQLFNSKTSIEFEYCPLILNNDDLSLKSFKLQFEYNQPKKLLIYFIDLDNLQKLCELNDTSLSDYTTINLVESLKHEKATINLTTSNDNYPQVNKIKSKIIIPIGFSIILILIIVFLAIFLKRYYGFDGHKSNEKSSKFLHSSLKSNNSSTLESVESSSQSTTITQMLSSQSNSKFYYVDPHTYEDPSLAVQQFANEINPQDIKIESVIGGGEFGDVCKGKLRLIKSDVWITVAIKTLKMGSSERSRCDFLTEASLMAQFQHENIIFLEGVVTKSNPYMILLEYMENGSLDTYLRLNSWRLGINDLLRFLRDVASGMQYLSEMNFVHRDLAARNILLNKDLRCKVADFGLSRELESDNTDGAYWTKGGKIPVRWTAPEAINYRKFTTSSDIWSYGILAWEVMNFGERPYWNWSNQDVLKCIEKGFRLPAPSSCPVSIYQLMLKCWNIDRLDRPKFRQIVQTLDLITTQKDTLSNIASNNLISFIDTNKPNVSQLTSIEEWLASLNLTTYSAQFKKHGYVNLFQILNIQQIELNSIGIWNQTHQKTIFESLKAIQLEIAFRNGFLV